MIRGLFDDGFELYEIQFNVVLLTRAVRGFV